MGRGPVLDLGKLPSRLWRDGSLSHYLNRKEPLSTGILGLDRLLGGGWPRHEISYLQGEETTGKSSLCEEAIYRFSRTSSGITILACLPGEHPLPGFEDRLTHLQKQRVFTIHPDSIEHGFEMAKSIIRETLEWNKEVLLVVDDLTSLCQSNSPVAAVTYSINKVRPYLRRFLSILLVNQVRETHFSELIGATAYWRAFSASSVVLHLSPSQSRDEDTLRTTVTVLKPYASLGKTVEFSIRPGRGIVE
jgi:archaellum biogenesis ATPase FlaH